MKSFTAPGRDLSARQNGKYLWRRSGGRIHHFYITMRVSPGWQVIPSIAPTRAFQLGLINWGYIEPRRPIATLLLWVYTCGYLFTPHISTARRIVKGAFREIKLFLSFPCERQLRQLPHRDSIYRSNNLAHMRRPASSSTNLTMWNKKYNNHMCAVRLGWCGMKGTTNFDLGRAERFVLFAAVIICNPTESCRGAISNNCVYTWCVFSWIGLIL